MSEPRLRFEVGARDAGKRLDCFLKERIPGLSRTRIRKMIEARVTLSWNVSPRPGRPVIPGGTVKIEPRPSTECIETIELPVLACGDGWLAVAKPAGIPVHPARDVVENSLIRALRRQEGDPGLRLAHRLDAETSGVLLVARHADAARVFARAFAQGDAEKEYLAWVRGEVAEDSGRIDAAIGEHPTSEIRIRLAAGVEGGKPSVTEWCVERRARGATLLRLFPRHGRRHQLRVHLERLGHAIAGDMLYGRPDVDYLDMIAGRRDPRAEDGGPARQLLHCARLRLPAPEGGRLDLAVDPPEDFAAWETTLAERAYSRAADGNTTGLR